MTRSHALSGTLIAGRFELVDTAGTGGMGTVYRAEDRARGGWVALKMLHGLASQSQIAERFAREARLLSELRHDGIVSYIAHGLTPDGQAYIAMEWLDGEDLSRRLRRGLLRAQEAVAIAVQVAESLEFAHRNGVLHRDVKPGNIFLLRSAAAPDGNGMPAGTPTTKLLDFGIARQSLTHTLTRTGAVIGTIEYMAPEQARGQRELSSTVDLYSLGCVLYECLTGEPPFVGEHPAAVLARILIDDAVPLAQRRTGLPSELTELVDQLLLKDPAKRPTEVSGRLRAILARLPAESGTVEVVSLRRQQGQPAAMTHGEVRLVSAVFASPPRLAGDDHTEEFQLVATQRRDAASREVPAAVQMFRGARITWLSDGWLLAVFENVGVADQLMHAARLAMELHKEWQDSQVALAVVRRGMADPLAVGPLVDCCSRVLKRAHRTTSDNQGIPGVWLDEMSAGLLESRFNIEESPVGLRLLGERGPNDDLRLFLGRPMPCVGRDQELGMLELWAASCLEEPMGRAVMVVAPPGYGKSRLVREFSARIARRGHPLTMMLGRCDPLTESSPYAPLRQALLSLCDAQVGLDEKTQQAQLYDRIGANIPASERQRVVEFMGELVGIPFPLGAQNAQLRAARHDPKLMRDQIAQALIDFLRAECQGRLVVLVLEDLHWADALTVQLLDEALLALSEHSLLVLALARPEVSTRFPDLWASRHVDVINLRGLGKKACERLAQQVLGGRVPAPLIERVIALADGNALFLEELMRAALSGSSEWLPPSVLAILEHRVQSLAPDARRVLRAASVFGETFWQGGVRALCGESSGMATTADETPSAVAGVERWLTLLGESELIERRRQSRFAGDTEYAFRHALMREAVYQTLTDSDRRIGHRIAANYLTAVGERDAFVVARHFERGEEPGSAAEWYVRAAEQSFMRYDLANVHQRATHAIELGADGALRGTARSLQALSTYWNGEWDRTLPTATEAVALCPPGGVYSCRAAGVLTMAAVMRGRSEMLPELVGRFLATAPQDDAVDAFVEAGNFMTLMFVMVGQRQLVRTFIERMKLFVGNVAEESIAHALLSFCHGAYLRLMAPAPWHALKLLRDAHDRFHRAGDGRNTVLSACLLGLAEREAGDSAAGEAVLRAALQIAARMPGTLVPTVQLHLAMLLELRDSPEAHGEAEALARAVTESFGVNSVYVALAQGSLALAQLRSGRCEEAAALARTACDALAATPVMQALVLPTLIDCTRATGRSSDAVALADRCLALFEQFEDVGYVEPIGRFAAAQAYRSAGDEQRAIAQIRAAAERIRRRAASAPEPSLSARFLRELPENARVLALCGPDF